ncbi:MAG: hypothetical protein GX675_05855 [Erysipelotrichaceae bacterium]|nr:hypothetical protein [Erysipelotrichaceae bacterium]
MRLWRSFLEICQFPLKIIFLGVTIYGIGNTLISPTFSSLFVIKRDEIILLAELLNRLGSLIIINAPLIFLLRTVYRRVNGATTVMSGFIGYITYLVVTMLFASKNLPSSAFSAILGISFSSTSLSNLSGINYPLQTGIAGAIIVTFTTRISYRQSRNKTQYGFFSFIDKDIHAVIINVLYCSIAGGLVAFLYLPFYESLNKTIELIASDITNPMNLFTYGVVERVLSTLHMSTLIRKPFWFQATGGTWANLVGESIAGDVNIWAVSLASNQLQYSAGTFITPYYVLNIFAIPSMLWGIYSIYTDKYEKRRVRLFFVLATLVSIFSGTMFPLEILLLLLSPLLYLFHTLYTGSLFAVFEVLDISLGFNYTGTNTVVASPGTILEFITYMKNPNLANTLRMIAIVGFVSALIYFFFTRFYFRHLAVDLFNTGTTKRLVKGTTEAIGGTSNIKMINTSVNILVIQVFDPTLIDAGKLLELGATKVTDTKAGLSIQFGAASTIVGRELNKSLRETLKST